MRQLRVSVAAAVVSVVAVMSVAACSAGADDSSGPREPLIVEPPVTIIGTLDVSVEEGPVGADEISEVNFGSVETDDGYVLIEVWADVVRSSGISREELVGGGTFSVRLDGPSEFFDDRAPTYLVAALESLD